MLFQKSFHLIEQDVPALSLGSTKFGKKWKSAKGTFPSTWFDLISFCSLVRGSNALCVSQFH